MGWNAIGGGYQNDWRKWGERTQSPPSIGTRRITSWDSRTQERSGSHGSETFCVSFKCGLKFGDGYAKISALRSEDADAQFPNEFL
jgi:hypothetical protein